VRGKTEVDKAVARIATMIEEDKAGTPVNGEANKESEGSDSGT